MIRMQERVASWLRGANYEMTLLLLKGQRPFLLSRSPKTVLNDCISGFSGQRRCRGHVLPDPD